MKLIRKYLVEGKKIIRQQRTIEIDCTHFVFDGKDCEECRHKVAEIAFTTVGEWKDVWTDYDLGEELPKDITL